MSDSSPKLIRTACRRRIAGLRLDSAERARLESQIANLVTENIRRGRFERLAVGYSKRHRFTLSDYVDRVILCTRSEQQRVQALADGDPDEWNKLRSSLATCAYHMLLGFRNAAQAQTEAADFAQETCLVIFSQHYPSDISFDAWARTILKHKILARYTRSPDALNRAVAPDSLDAPLGSAKMEASSRGDLIPDPQSSIPFEKIENQALLLQAIAQLRSREQQQVIVWTYLDELSVAEIAERLHKNVQVVYNLRCRGLARLKQILQN